MSTDEESESSNMSTDEESESSTPVVEKTVGQLEPRMREVNITVKVMSKTDPREVPSRVDGALHKVADALVGDSTGCLLMTLWDDTIDKVKENETISIKNGYVSLFQGSMRLNTGKYGTIEPTERTLDEVNKDNNLSDRRFEQERRYPKFRPLYGDMDRRRQGDRGGRSRRRR